MNEPEDTDDPFVAIISASGGYDTNPDEIEDPDHSATTSFDTNVWLRHAADGLEAEALLSGTLVATPAISAPRRYLYSAQLSLTYTLSESTDLVADTSREFDALSDPVSIYDEASISIELDTDSLSIALSGDVERLRYRLRDSDEEQDGEDEEVTDERGKIEGDRDDIFDATGERVQDISDPEILASLNYHRISAYAHLELATDRPVAPFIEAEVGKVVFPQPLPDSIDRNAADYWFIAGVVLRPHETIELALGARHNRRDFRSPALRTESSTYLDVDLTFAPTNRLELSGSVERTFESPEFDESRVRDAQAYELTMQFAPSPAWRLKVDTSYEVGNELGAGAKDRELEISGEVAYRLSSSVSLIASGRYIRYIERVEGETPLRYQRIVSMIGLRARM